MTPLSRDQVRFLAVGLAGSLLVSVSAQFPSANIADLQGGLASTPDEASWILTAYAVASLIGVVVSGLLIRSLSIGRYMVANAVAFAATSLACAAGPDLGLMIGLRAVQGFAAGGFGPAAFAATFVVAAGGPRLPFLTTLLAFVLVLPSTLGPVLSGFLEESLGWQALFLAQAGIGAALAVAAHAWVPRKQLDWSALKVDWVAVILLSIAVATLILVLSQGTRRFWFDSDMIAWCAAACIGAGAGFAFLTRFSPLPLIAPRLLIARKFGVAIGLNFTFRASLAVTAYLVPQFLAVTQGYRPLEVAKLMLWAAVPQIFALPLAWRLMHAVDARIVMALGLGLCAAGTAIAIDVTALTAGDQFRPTLVLFAVGQVLFLVPALLVGSSGLKLPDLPTAALFFNLATLGGTTAGVGLVSHLTTEREKFHSSVITEHVSLYRAADADRVALPVDLLANRQVDDASAAAQAIVHLARSATREAWILSFGDAFLVVAGVLLLSALGVVAIGQAPPLQKSPIAAGGKP